MNVSTPGEPAHPHGKSPGIVNVHINKGRQEYKQHVRNNQLILCFSPLTVLYRKHSTRWQWLAFLLSWSLKPIWNKSLTETDCSRKMSLKKTDDKRKVQHSCDPSTLWKSWLQLYRLQEGKGIDAGVTGDTPLIQQDSISVCCQNRSCCRFDKSLIESSVVSVILKATLSASL